MNSGEIEDLKRRIGEVAGGKAYNPKHAYTKSLEELIEDLKVYQYELEFQNEELKRIQNDLEQSREEYYQLFENAPACYVIIDNNFRILKRNKLFDSHFGEFLHEKEQFDFRSLLEAASQDVFYFFCQELFTTGIAHPVEVNMRSSDGKICCMQIEANASVGATEVVYRMSLNDLTENKTLYTAIVASEKEKRMITDNVNDMVVISDSSGIISYVSPSIKQFGFLPADYIGKTLFDFVHPDDAQMAMQAFNEGVGAKGKNAIIFRTPVKNGGYLWVETSGTVVLDDEQEVVQAVFVVRNIEDRKKAEDELKYANDLLSQVGVMARIGAWELRAEDNYLFWSPVTRIILGVDASYVPNLPETFLFFPIGDTRQSIISSLENAFTKGVEFDLEAKINTVDRGLIWVRIKGIPVFENAKVVKLRGLFQDINEIKQAELLLKDYTHELRESNTAKDKLFSIIAHDLRSPFNAFLNLTEILNQEFNSLSDEEIKKITETIYSSALNINDLINNLLEWSRL
ncbi:MAG TPA: PAS domain S-box protein, partial [Bacteroidales bacterium]|nr:PAS domain S-box protein [Bacteroidales bacterium]